MSEAATPDSARHWSAAVVLAWVLAGVGTVLFSLGACVTPAVPWLLAEVALFAFVGFAVSRLLEPGWKSGLAAPGALTVLSAVWRSGVLDDWAQVASYVVGPVLLVVLMRVLHDLTRRLPPLVSAVLLSVLGVCVGRVVTLLGARVALPVEQFTEDLTRPITGPSAPAPTSDAPPIVVISVDTLRADSAKDMKTWAWFAERGATWSAAQSTASWTVPAIGSTWTGLMPVDHGAGDLPKGFASLKPESDGVVTFAEQAVEAGYATAAFVANPFVSTSMGFRRGFQSWINPDEAVAQPLTLLGARYDKPGRDGEVVVGHALEWLENAPDNGIFLWVHLFDPHLPYTHLEPDHPALVVKHPKQVRRGKIKATDALKSAVREAYHIEVAYSDDALQALLDAVEEKGIPERGAVLFFSDHGEELWEHDDFEHGHSHHREVTEVPLALVAGCVTPGERTGVVSLQDVAPTLRQIAGLLPPPAPRQGQSLCDPVAEDRVVTTAGNLYGPPQASARTLTEKVIETRPKKGMPRAMLYDLRADPWEQRGSRPLSSHPLAKQASEMQTAADGQDAAPVPTGQLCALGYMSGPECD